jgi:alkanesulfonate monooxygenase SsuD/methylene tetrahydromethanopterin reductase-like flavin-dependent oxidoreductase (luciferase family)
VSPSGGAHAPPFAAGSVSLGLHLHQLSVPEALDELLAQAALADDGGIDGICLSEHHGGFAGYVPNPVLAASWLLGATRRCFVAATPTILPLRAARLVAEDAAWTAARFPGRFGLAVAPGYDDNDFRLAGVDRADRFKRFAEAIAVCHEMLTGGNAAESDEAIRATRSAPVPLLSTASSGPAARRAAAVGTGLLIDSFTDLTAAGRIVEEYRSHGGHGPTVLNRRIWVGTVPAESLAQMQRAYATAGQGQAWLDVARENIVLSGPAADIAAKLTDALALTGAGSLNLRVHLPTVAPPDARDQIGQVCESVLPLIRF